jgi:hypothetical protein
MSKFLLTLIFALASVLSAHAKDCSIKLNMGGGLYPETTELAVQTKMEKALAKKGYIATTSSDAEYSMNIYYGNAMTMTDCYIFAAHIRIENSGKQIVAEAGSETSFLRELLDRGSIPKAMTRKAFKKLIKKLPGCEVTE